MVTSPLSPKGGECGETWPCLALHVRFLFCETQQLNVNISVSTATMADVASDRPLDAVPAPFPAPTRTASASIGATITTITRISFADKILLTVTQAGRLNHWVHVPLSNAAPSESSMLNASNEMSDDHPDATLLPYSHLTATTVLGGTKPEFEVLGQTLATTVASAILMQTAEEQRMLVLGIGLETANMGKDDFEAMLGLCLDVL